MADRRVSDLPDLLRPGDILVVNDTRVLPARLFGRRAEAKVETTLHKPLGGGRWRAFARPARKLQTGDRIAFAEDFEAEVIVKGDGGEITLDFGLTDSALTAALQRHGAMPLPPYIKRNGMDDSPDRDDYQTLFARVDGAVAAPTAGLHFTERLLAALQEKGVERVNLTLHVGAGTFLPVKSEQAEDHVLHAERGLLTTAAAERLNRARAAGGRLVAIGTTALRLLESAAQPDGTLRSFDGETDLYILPGYKFRAVDLLLTNFHLPRSTLFMLVCAFAGTARMKAAYRHALDAGYRFYSYGDATLLHRDGAP